jgi:hypothetical protein
MVEQRLIEQLIKQLVRQQLIKQLVRQQQIITLLVDEQSIFLLDNIQLFLNIYLREHTPHIYLGIPKEYIRSNIPQHSNP